MNTDKLRSREHQHKYFGVFNFRLLSVSICVYLWLIFLISFGSKPGDLRTLIPANSLVYLESNDLGAVMKTITERPAFREAAKTVPDFSALNGVKLAVAVTGFETKEQPVTDENSRHDGRRSRKASPIAQLSNRRATLSGWHDPLNP